MPATGAGRKVVPAQLGFLAIYNPSLGATDETIENQIVYYSNNRRRTGDSNKARKPSSKNPEEDGIREERNEQLRQIGLAQGMVEFGRSFSDGAAVGTVETEKSRIILHELEAGWWILAVSDNLDSRKLCLANQTLVHKSYYSSRDYKGASHERKTS
jgi:hypothetical protein